MMPIRVLLLVSVLHFIGCSEPSAVPPKSAAEMQSDSSASPPAENQAAETQTAETGPPESSAAGKDAMTLYREAQGLMKEGRSEEGYRTAALAMKQFVAEDIDLPWMLLESVEAGDRRIDIHFNMGESERNLPDDGIVRPLSFRIWSGDQEPELIQVLDFEIGRFGGRSLTAAIGEMTDTGHANYGILETDASYETIRQRVIDIVTQE